MSTLTINDIVERVGMLPRLPDTTYRLISVISDPMASIDQIVETIRYDQAATADVLRLCNSAFFGLSRKVNSIDDALRLLGTTKVLQLVMSTHTRALLSGQQEGYGLPQGALWRHSVGTAIGAQILARRFGVAEMGLLFTTGLLHDIGKIALGEYVAAEYAEITRRVTEERHSFVEAERAVLGFTHAEVGAQLAESWSLPQAIARCIRYHHEPNLFNATDPLVDAVHLADATCLLMGIGIGDDGLQYRAHPATMARYNLNEADLETIGCEIVLELKSVQQVFAEN